MTTNDLMRSLRFMLKLNSPKIAEICTLGGCPVTKEQIDHIFRNDEDPEFVPCPEKVVAHFLDGLIFHKRGKDETRPALPIELPLSNNLVLKKLRVAFQLREEDMLKMIQVSGFKFGKNELSAILRKRDQPNYRECGDQVLRYFLKGLTEHIQATPTKPG
ncbi:MAG: DUF1456 family protein [Pseudobdellovibrionaceae bacterium]